MAPIVEDKGCWEQECTVSSFQSPSLTGTVTACSNWDSGAMLSSTPSPVHDKSLDMSVNLERQADAWTV